eukprot:4327914-Heterocapsa_arctica.AAC.1
MHPLWPAPLAERTAFGIRAGRHTPRTVALPSALYAALVTLLSERTDLIPPFRDCPGSRRKKSYSSYFIICRHRPHGTRTGRRCPRTPWEFWAFNARSHSICQSRGMITRMPFGPI